MAVSLPEEASLRGFEDVHSPQLPVNTYFFKEIGL